MKNFIKRGIYYRIRRKPLLIKPVRNSKIDNLRDAVEYLNKNKQITTKELNELMTEDIIYSLKLMGYIKRGIYYG